MKPLLPTRPRPKTPIEKAFVAAALALYDEQRKAGASPEDAWHRGTELFDDALVRVVMRDERRA